MFPVNKIKLFMYDVSQNLFQCPLITRTILYYIAPSNGEKKQTSLILILYLFKHNDTAGILCLS